MRQNHSLNVVRIQVTWLEAAPVTSAFVSSTKALAVFTIVSRCSFASIGRCGAFGEVWFSDPLVANKIVVSRSPIIPETVLAALIQAWVPRDPSCNAAKTSSTRSTTCSDAVYNCFWIWPSYGWARRCPPTFTASMQAVPSFWVATEKHGISESKE